MSNEFWIGVLLSVPIGIGTGLAVAPIQRWMGNWNAASRQTKRERQRREYLEVLFFLGRPELLAPHLIITVLALLGFLMIIVLAGVGESALPKQLTEHNVIRISTGFWKGAYLIVILGGTAAVVSTITRLVDSSATLYRRVAGFEKYAESVSPDVRDLELEVLIKGKAGR